MSNNNYDVHDDNVKLEEIFQEGIINRARARIASANNKVANAAGRVKNTAVAAGNNLTGNTGAAQQAQNKLNAATQQDTSALAHLRPVVVGQVTKVLTKLLKDSSKLSKDANVTNAINSMVGDKAYLDKALAPLSNKLYDDVEALVSSVVASKTPPPMPQQQQQQQQQQQSATPPPMPQQQQQQ